MHDLRSDCTKRVAVFTLACKVNQADSDSLAGLFVAHGYTLVDFASPADVYVVNTCTVTNLADRKSKQQLRRAARRNPGAVVVATGCLAQTDAEALLSEIPGLSIVVGTSNRSRTLAMVEQALRATAPVRLADVAAFGGSEGFEEFPAPPTVGRTRATLKIEDGCDEFCSYCKVPYARGPVRSRDIGRIRDEVERLAGSGFKEIVLTGVHLGHYGKEGGYHSRLSDVTEVVAAVAGIERVRLSSIDPPDVSDAIVQLVAHHPKVCQHLHIPLQGGHNDVLQRMHRRYSLEDYTRLIDTIRAQCESVAVTTDVIVGFPGESQVHFQSAMDFVRSTGFARLHVFKYSLRSGTLASSFSDQIASGEKDRRSRELILLGQEMSASHNRTLVGTIQRILVEEASDGCIGGLTDAYVRTEARAPNLEGVRLAACLNTLVDVQVETADDGGVRALLLEDSLK